MGRVAPIGEASVGGSGMGALRVLAAAKASCSEAAPRMCSTSPSHSSWYDSADDAGRPLKSSWAELCEDVGQITPTEGIHGARYYDTA